MSDIEKRVQVAFDAIEMPTHLKEKTLTNIDEKRLLEEAESSTSSEKGSMPRVGAQKVQSGTPILTPFSTPPRGEMSTEAVPSCSAAVQLKQGAGDAAVSLHSRTPSQKKRRVSLRQRVGAAIAACLCLLMVGFGGYAAYATETAYIDIDVNPSIGLGINRFDMVVTAQAYNDDGQRVLDAVSLVGKNYETALQELLQVEESQGYLKEESFVAINVACDVQTQGAALETSSATCVGRTQAGGYAYSPMTSEEHQAAQAAGVGMGKYRMYLLLQKLDPSITVDQCAQMPMSELRNRALALGANPEDLVFGRGMQGGRGHDESAQNDGSGNASGAQDAGHGGSSPQGSGQGHGPGGGNANGSGQGQGQGSGGGSADGSGQGQGRGQGQAGCV